MNIGPTGFIFGPLHHKVHDAYHSKNYKDWPKTQVSMPEKDHDPPVWPLEDFEHANTKYFE